MLFDPQQDTIARPHPAFVDMWRDWELCDDLDGGVDRMRWAALNCRERWLPREHLEENDQYITRVMRSDLYPGYSQGLDDAIARPFAKPVQVDNLPDEWEPWTWDTDGSGNDLTQFLSHFMRCAVKHGMAHIFIDFTNQGGGTVSRAAEQNTRPRPWWRLVDAPSLVNWKSETLPSGKHVLTEARIHEFATVPDGTYGEKPVEYIRVIRRDSYELWQNEAYNPPGYSADKLNGLSARYYNAQTLRMQKWVKVDEGAFGPAGGFESVPIVTAYTGYRDFMVAQPPFLSLAEANVTHWQSSSDQRNITHFARVPILFARGFNAEELQGSAIGAGTVISSGEPDASLSIVEHSGSAVQVGQEDLDRLERRMEQLGVRPHVERMQGATATGIAVNSASADTDVQAWAQGVDTAAEQAFEWSARWMGAEVPEDLDVQIYKDFAIEMIGGGDVPALQADVDKGRIRVETYLKEMKRRGIYADTLEIEEEVGASDERAEAATEMAKDASQTSADAAKAEPKAQPGEQKSINEELKQTSLNGAQVTALQGMIEAVAAGTLPAEAAEILILEAFPALDPAKVKRLVALASKVKTGGTPEEDTDESGGMPDDSNQREAE